MRLLLIHQYFAGPTEPGGTRHYELASHLVRARARMHARGQHAQLHRPANASSRAGGWSVEQNIDGIRVLRSYTIPSLHHSFAGTRVALVSFMITSVWAALRAKNIDLVMGTSPPLVSSRQRLVRSRGPSATAACSRFAICGPSSPSTSAC